MDERERRPDSEGIVIPPRPPLPPRPSEADPGASRPAADETVPIEHPASDAGSGMDASPETDAAAPEPAVTELLAAPGGAQRVEPPLTEPLGRSDDVTPAHGVPPTAAEPVAEPEATTLPLPVIGDPQGAPVAAPAPAGAPAVAEPPKKRRRRGRAVAWTLVTVVLVLAVVGVVGWFAGEAWAEKTVTATVQQQTAKALGLPNGKDVQVGLTDPVLPQVLAGSLKTLDITAPNTPIGGSTGTVKLHATGVPTSGSGTPTSATASATLSPDALKSLAGAQKDIVPGSVHVVGSNIAVTLNPAQFLSHVGFTLTFAPSVAQGQLVLTPSGFEVAGFDVSAETIRKRFGGLAAGILAPRTMCVASYFPKGLTLTGIQVSQTAVVTDFAVNPAIATDPSLQAKGTCS